jgi:hypothetical protein
MKKVSAKPISANRASRQNLKKLRLAADACRNPHIPALLVVARTYAGQIRKLVPRARVIVGGSLRSATAVRGKNDIDLRVLLPAGFDSPEHMAKTSAKIDKIIPFEHTLEKPPYLPLAYHHKKQARLARIGVVTVEANVQPGRGYFGLARKSAQLPAVARHSYLILKARALESGSKPEYKGVKNRWADLIHWLTKRRYFTKPQAEKRLDLQRARSRFPEFFAETALEFRSGNSARP